MKEVNTALRSVAFVGSPLQMATFRLSVYNAGNSLIIGNRGMDGHLKYTHSVLNDPCLLSQLDNIFGSDEVEVFLPHSLNGLFYTCCNHPQVKRISYLDEGRLTLKFLNEHHTKPPNPAIGFLATCFDLARRLPRSFQRNAFKVLCALHKKIISSPFEKDPDNYPYAPIDIRRKFGSVLCHINMQTALLNAEYVDLLDDVNFPENYKNLACCFIHPQQTSTNERVSDIIRQILNLNIPTNELLLRPHPLFKSFPSQLSDFTQQLAISGIKLRRAELTESQDTAVELYARGVRMFILTNDSTIGYTVESMPDFFSNLELVRLR